MTSTTGEPAWIAQVRQDISPFADITPEGPRLTIRVADERRVHIGWETDGNLEEAVLVADGTAVQSAEYRGRNIPYRALLSSAQFGDSSSLARSIVRYYGDPDYVDTLAKLVSSPDGPESALRVLERVLEEEREGVTQVVFLTGDAGAGKTSTLKRLAVKQARAFLEGEASSLFLYVNAQGKALSTLSQALSVALDDLRSRLTYDMIAPLIRNALLTLIVDGFDELLGSSYDDAFSSLTRFLDDLDGRGRIVACARSAYYEQEFLYRVSEDRRSTASWTVDRIELCDWNESQRDSLFDIRTTQAGLAPEQANSAHVSVRELFARPSIQPLTGKPFFVDRLIQLTLEDRAVEEGEEALLTLTEAYLAREVTEKLLDADGNPLLSGEQLRRVLVEVAAEMWDLETRVLKLESVRELVDYSVELEGVRDQVEEYLHLRGPMLGFLTSAAGGRRVEFEHELMFGVFLSMAFMDRLRAGSGLSRVLPRGVLPPVVPQLLSSLLRREQVDLTDSLKQICVETASIDLREEQARENGGALVAALTRRLGSVVGQRIHDVIFAGQAFSGVVFGECVFERVEFRRARLDTTRFVECRATQILFVEPEVDPQSTRLDIEGVDVASNFVGLCVLPVRQQLYSISEISGVLRQCDLPGVEAGSPSELNVRSDVVALLDRLARSFERTSLLWTSDPTMGWLEHEDSWPRVRDLLLAHGLVALDTRAQKGRQREVLRKSFNPSELMNGGLSAMKGDAGVRGFWEDVRNEFPVSR